MLVDVTFELAAPLGLGLGRDPHSGRTIVRDVVRDGQGQAKGVKVRPPGMQAPRTPRTTVIRLPPIRRLEMCWRPSTALVC